MVVGTLSLVQKCQTSGCGVCSGIVVYGGGGIVFKPRYCDAVQKRSNQLMQWTQGNSGIWWWAHCLWCRKVKPVDTVDAVDAKNSDMHTGDGANTGDAVNSEYYVTFMHQRQCHHHHISLFHCIHCIRWFDLESPLCNSYTT